MPRLNKSLGRLLARALTGAWRTGQQPPFELSAAELEQVIPLLMASGGAALGWQRLRDSELRNSPTGELLQQAYRLQSLQSEIQAQSIQKLFRLLRQASIEAVLAKGWAAANLYGDRTLRPFGDIDICVRARDHGRLNDVLSTGEAKGCWVDLHSNFSEIGNRSVEELFSRSKLLSIGDEPVRVLGDEDHLALLCIHFLKHGAWRPLWLCDVAAAIESAPSSFDWQLCLGTDRTRASWIKTTFSLAQKLLGASLDRLPSELRAVPVPQWLVDTIHKQWSHPFAAYQAPMNHPVPVSEIWRKPGSWPDGLRQGWPNPILATISVHGKLNNVPRLPYQIANCVSRVVRLIIPTGNEMQEH